MEEDDKKITSGGVLGSLLNVFRKDIQTACLVLPSSFGLAINCVYFSVYGKRVNPSAMSIVHRLYVVVKKTGI